MLLVKPKIGRDTSLIVNCSVCGLRLLIVETMADLDAKPFTYYCRACITNMTTKPEEIVDDNN